MSPNVIEKMLSYQNRTSVDQIIPNINKNIQTADEHVFKPIAEKEITNMHN